MKKIMIYVVTQMMIATFIFSSGTPTPAPEEKKTKFVGGAITGDFSYEGGHEGGIEYKTLGETIEDGVIDAIKRLAKRLYIFLTPFLEWIPKMIICINVIIFSMTGQKKSIANIIKFFFIYVGFMMIGSVFNG